jgi:hypothetical protein
VVYPDGSVVHMPDISKAMSLTPYVPGIRLETWPEEDTKEWKDLWSRI